MADDTFRINVDQVRSQAPKFEDLATQLETGLSSLQSTLAGYGEMWGNDEFGARFAQNYTGKAEEALTLIQGAVAMFRHLNSGVGTAANLAEGVEQNSAAAIQKTGDAIDRKA
ncbi:uncharacterized protein YukE [Nocardia transvalensis]|uniref:Uncharacterized protein YukE n=1 Tax=Nocardia transvalensis TaxID=37333 RepID=A0A7W9UIU2_9NOCA|nr:hypothetical protein [Nocardia transvalensis]MBB5914763.1 uncharacterized protein YukE [Nocardia transvalensis]